MYQPEDILETARAIRPYLPQLLHPTPAANLDQRLGDLLAEAEQNPSIPLLVLKQLREHSTTREWAENFLRDQQFADQHRGYNPLVGEHTVNPAKFICPQCSYTWSREANEEIPLCPTDLVSLVPAPA